MRSTTPCVAVNSRSNSTLLTVISMVPTATAASTGIKSSPVWLATFITSLISNTKPIKPAVIVGTAEKWKTLPTGLLSPLWGLAPSVRNRSRSWRRPYKKIPTFLVLPERCTVSTSHSQTGKRKTAPPGAKRVNFAIYPPNCSVSLLSNLFKSLSFLRTVSIFSTECRTVV